MEGVRCECKCTQLLSVSPIELSMSVSCLDVRRNYHASVLLLWLSKSSRSMQGVKPIEPAGQIRCSPTSAVLPQITRRRMSVATRLQLLSGGRSQGVQAAIWRG